MNAHLQSSIATTTTTPRVARHSAHRAPGCATQERAETTRASGVVAARDVRDLIDAAGPLSLSDIAGGLGLPLRHAAPVVLWMLDNGCLRQDEWGRHVASDAERC